jgi:hypothetical protein
MKKPTTGSRKTIGSTAPGHLRRGRALSTTARALPGLRIEEVDGRLVVVADREVELRCGRATIVLAPDGTIRIKGTNLLSSASALNRIRGASVKIN